MVKKTRPPQEAFLLVRRLGVFSLPVTPGALAIRGIAEQAQSRVLPTLFPKAHQSANSCHLGLAGGTAVSYVRRLTNVLRTHNSVLTLGLQRSGDAKVPAMIQTPYTVVLRKAPETVSKRQVSTIPLGRSGRSRTPLPPECGSDMNIRALRSHPRDVHTPGLARRLRPPIWPGVRAQSAGCDVGGYYAPGPER